jgi:hypothetical protein
MGGALGVNAVRLAETAMRANGGFQVFVRMPGLAASGQDSEQLGLTTPSVQDEALGPAVWRNVGVDTALLVPAVPVTALMGTAGFATAKALFEAAVGVLVDGVLYTVADCEPIVAGGVDCGYRLSVTGPAWD